MQFYSLRISNLRAIRQFSIDQLSNFVVVAGQNGCGKSCVFDAIRLLKSVYGGYAANEYHQWFGEFAVNLQDPKSIAKLFRDPSKPIEIEATLSFASNEATYLAEHADELAQPIAWQEVTGQPVDFWTFNRTTLVTQLRQNGPELASASQRVAGEVRDALGAGDLHTLALRISPTGDISTADCRPAEMAFQAYQPRHLGVIEYHSASRSYSRQQIGGINLDTRAFEDQQRQQRLYNAQNKYQNIKSELATSYLRALIATQSGDAPADHDLNETLKELFLTFFPDKTYEGVRPLADGSLEFPVRLSTGEEHDIDELSSGEKEILYGYLKLKNSTPANSVILLDEPELHLNPSLLQGFADFYYRHLGVAQSNQLWLVTHSDTLLRQAVGNANYRVYHMVPATAPECPANQAVEVLADDDVERVTIDLVGDLASYRPHGKVVVLEGRSEHGFDVNMVRRLFPEFARRVNLVSGGNKQRVRDLYAALHEAASQVGMKNRFFAIVDKDSAPPADLNFSGSEFAWNVYHIENYLLDPGSIREATTSLLTGNDVFGSDDAVFEELRSCAAELLNGLVLERLQYEVNDLLVNTIAVGGPSDTQSPATDLKPSLDGSFERLGELRSTLTEADLQERASRHRAVLEAALTDGTWQSEFPGRSVLRRYAGKHLHGRIDSLLFSNAVLDKMVERGVRPEAMQGILDEIASC